MKAYSNKELRYRLETAYKYIRECLGDDVLQQYIKQTDKEWMLERMNDHYKQMSFEEFEARLNNQKW